MRPMSVMACIIMASTMLFSLPVAAQANGWCDSRPNYIERQRCYSNQPGYNPNGRSILAARLQALKVNMEQTSRRFYADRNVPDEVKREMRQRRSTLDAYARKKCGPSVKLNGICYGVEWEAHIRDLNFKMHQYETQ